MLNTILLKLAKLLESISVYIRYKIRERVSSRFISKNNLNDGIYIQKIDRRYNPYELTNLLLIDKIIKDNVIDKNDIIMDVGCGAGILLLYLLSKGFIDICGVEMDTTLYKICKNNIEQFKTYNVKYYGIDIKIYNINAIDLKIDDNINCFYLYNPFFDMDTYKNWLMRVHESLQRRQRHIKIIFLYPTLAVKDAVKSCSWLARKRYIKYKEQICYRCIKFLIVENEI